MKTAAAKKKRSFADIAAKYKRYNPEVEGYGSPEQWNEAFQNRMGFEEAQKVIHGQEKTPRDILGVNKQATWDEITKAYRRAVIASHPDRVALTGMTVKDATEVLSRVNAAFSVLAREFGK